MSDKLLSETNESGEAVGLLISILIAYPQVCGLNCTADEKTIKLSFLLANEDNNITSHRMDLLESRLRNNLLLHSQLKGTSPDCIDISYEDIGEYVYIFIIRDLDSLTKEEINLISATIKDFGFDLVIDDYATPIIDEDVSVHEEIITHMLATIKNQTLKKTFIAYRENGKVLVFNK